MWRTFEILTECTVPRGAIHFGDRLLFIIPVESVGAICVEMVSVLEGWQDFALAKLLRVLETGDSTCISF